MLHTWRTLAAGRHPDPDAADCLLRHHTDLAVDWHARDDDGRTTFWIDPQRAVAYALAEMPDVPHLLRDAAAFDGAVSVGLTSPSLPRRDLAWRLACLAG